jgi:uncharacterized repeat protein (TIGR01451 family)
MKSVINIKRSTAAAAAVLAALFAASGAQALGTKAGTSISNTAAVDFKVGNVAQPQVVSAPVAFIVDRKVDFKVSTVDTVGVQGAPGQTGVVTTFKVKNDSNAAEGFLLTPSNLASGSVFGNADNQDVAPNPPAVFVDSTTSGTPGTYDVGIDTATSILTLAADATATVFIVANVPAAATNGQFANVRLTAQATIDGTATPETNTTGGDTAGQDVVLADTGGDNSEFSDDQYAIKSAILAVSKTSKVISDPLNGVSANAKAIPGAVIEYAVTIVNSGGAGATNVSVADTLNAELALATGGYNGGAADVSITVGTTTTFCSVGSGGCTLAGQVLTVNPNPPVTGISVPNGVAPANTAVVKFRATIRATGNT